MMNRDQFHVSLTANRICRVYGLVDGGISVTKIMIVADYPEYICEQDEEFYDSMLEGLEGMPDPSWIQNNPTQAERQ
jgi:hypothetical protein